EHIDYYGDWLTPVIREMSHLPGFYGDAHWVQEHLNFPQRLEEVKKSLKVLAELGYLTHDKKKDVYRVSPKAPETLKADTLTAIAYHQQMIEQGKESLTRLTGKQREVSGCTARMTEEKYQRIKAKLKEIIDEVAAEET